MLVKRSQSGLGIGLTLVRRLVEMHGGTVSVDSAGEGHGSEFVVSLPIATSHSQKMDRSAGNPKLAALPQRRVLVVDDNQDAAASLGMLLKVLGADVQTAHSGQMALDMIESNQPDVVLMDIRMPGMDGFEVARRIRERAEFDEIVLIALT